MGIPPLRATIAESIGAIAEEIFVTKAYSLEGMLNSSRLCMKKALDCQARGAVTAEITSTITMENSKVLVVSKKILINADSEKKSEERLLKCSSQCCS